MIAIGVAIDPAQVDAGVLAAALLALVLAAQLWWIYFGHDAEQAEHMLASATGGDRVRVALGGYFYAFIPMLLGVVSIAAGIKKSLGQFGDPLGTPAAVTLAVGVALYLVGQIGFHWMLRLGAIRLRLGVAVAAAALATVGVWVSAAAELIGLVLLLGALIATESVAAGRRAPLSPSAATAGRGRIN